MIYYYAMWSSQDDNKESNYESLGKLVEIMLGRFIQIFQS